MYFVVILEFGDIAAGKPRQRGSLSSSSWRPHHPNQKVKRVARTTWGLDIPPRRPTPRDLISPARRYLPRYHRLLRPHPQLGNNCSKHKNLWGNTLHSNHTSHPVSSLHYYSVANSVFSGPSGLYSGLP